eukprot:15451640-Alexandrium_andersonii.AAC.1
MRLNRGVPPPGPPRLVHPVRVASPPPGPLRLTPPAHRRCQSAGSGWGVAPRGAAGAPGEAAPQANAGNCRKRCFSFVGAPCSLSRSVHCCPAAACQSMPSRAMPPIGVERWSGPSSGGATRTTVLGQHRRKCPAPEAIFGGGPGGLCGKPLKAASGGLQRPKVLLSKMLLS